MAVNFNSDPYAFRCVMEHLNRTDLFNLAQVSSCLNILSNDQNIWLGQFAKEKMPLVESFPDQPRNYKQDFRVLFPITTSGSMIERLFGEMVGDIPRISVQLFDMLNQVDLFAGEKKTMGETFVFIVVPHLLKRTVSKEFPCSLDKEGNLTINKSWGNSSRDDYSWDGSSDEEFPSALDKQDNLTINDPWENSCSAQELMIPFSARNLNVLCSYPLERKETMLVFMGSKDSVFNSCKPCANKVSVFFMRREICCRNMSYPDQKQVVEDLGFEVTSLTVRALFNAVCILTSGTCPDAQCSFENFARTSDVVEREARVFPSFIGARAPRLCSYVSDYFSGSNIGEDDFRCAHDSIGVVPGIPAEATLAIGS